MQDAGDSDSGGLEKTAPSEDSGTVELRKSCDYCVRLKRACDGKNPCSLCLRRHKPCTRSARKKSGPAKGTKYAPRRKRSVIAEWADRAAFGAREHAQLHGSLSSPFGRMGVAGGGGQVGGGGGGVYGGGPPLHIHASQAEAARAAMPFPIGMSHSQVRHRADVWGDPAAAAAMMPGGRGPPPPPLPPPSSNLPVPNWYVKQELSASRAEPGGGGAHRRLAPRLEPPPAGLAPGAGEGPPRRQHATPSSWSAPPMETPPRQGLSRFETVATAAGLQVGGVMEAGPGSGPGRLQGQGEGERAPPPPGARGRMWDPPPPGQWASSQTDAFSRPPGSGQGMRVRLSPPCLPPDAARLLARQGSDPYGPGAQSPRGRGGDGGSAAPSPKRPRERDQEESSPPMLPPPREPPDPTAGFTFLPAAKLLSWRRPSPLAPWEPRTDFGGSSHTQSPPFDYSDRPASWSSADGGGGGGGGSGAGSSGAGSGGGGGGITAGRRYYEEHGGAAAEAQQGGGAQKLESFEWQLPSVETDAYRERYGLLPPPRAAGRHQQPQERRVSLGGGGSGSGGGGGGGGSDERQSEGYAPEAVRSAPSSPGARLEGGRRRSFGGTASGAAAFERQLERPGGSFSPDTAAHRGGDRDVLEGQESRHREDQQMSDSGRRGPPPDVHGWEGSHRGARVLSSPPMVMLPTPDAGGAVTPGGLGFEGASMTASSGLERAPRPTGGGGSGGGGGGGSSMPYQWALQRKSQGGGEEGVEREGGGEGDRHLRAGGGSFAARSAADTLGGATTTPTPRNSLEEGGRHGGDGGSPRSSSLPGARSRSDNFNSSHSAAATAGLTGGPDDAGRDGTGGGVGGDARGDSGGGDGRQWGGNNGESGRSMSLPYPRSRTGGGEPRALEPPPPQQQQQQQQLLPSPRRSPDLAPPPPQQQQQQQSPPRQWTEGREEAWRPEWGDQMPPGGSEYPPLPKKDGSS